MFRLMRWSAVPAIALFFLASAPSAALQVQATAVMKSGERHTGVNAWVRSDKGEFALRKSQHEELRVPMDQVAYLDFGGSPDVSPNVSGSQWALVMRNGTVVRGQLIELGHTDLSDTSSPFVVTFRDEQGQERRFQANEVARVYFPGGGTTGTTGTTTPTTGSTIAADGSIIVRANQQWTPAGITVRRGETLTFNTTGEIQLSADANDIATPAGAKTPRYAANAPMPRELAGALVGRIGPNGQPFGIGNLQSVTMPAAGQLFLGINDDHLNDNSGEFRVQITRRGGIRR